MGQASTHETAGQRAPGTARALPMVAQLQRIREECRRLSEAHRLSLPPEVVRQRLLKVGRLAEDLLERRTVEVCFLLDQYGSLTEAELGRALAPMKPRHVATRLAALERAGVVARFGERRDPKAAKEYALGPRGETFVDLLFPFLLEFGPQAEASAPPEDANPR